MSKSIPDVQQQSKAKRKTNWLNIVGLLLIIVALVILVLPPILSRTKSKTKYVQVSNEFIKNFELPEEDQSSFDMAKAELKMIGVLYIPKIDLQLPTYHGISEEALSNGVGSMEQFGDVTGEESTHPVLTSHNGMATTQLFNNLPKLELGDEYYFLNNDKKILKYKVVDIKTVLPTDSSVLGVEHGKSLLSLITCVPENINSHRLVVKSELVDIQPYQETYLKEIQEKNELTLTMYEKFCLVVLLIVILILIRMIYKNVKDKRKNKFSDINNIETSNDVNSSYIDNNKKKEETIIDEKSKK